MTDKYFVSTDKAERHIIDENHISLLPVGLIEISKSEYDALVSEPQVKTDSEKLSEFKTEVQSALDKSDLVALRAFKAGVPFSDVWSKYDSALRAMMSITEWSDDLVLPTQPETYPS